MGKMVLMPKFDHNGKATPMTLPDGSEVKSVQGSEKAGNILVWTKVINL